jgi:hypothetical protein
VYIVIPYFRPLLCDDKGPTYNTLDESFFEIGFTYFQSIHFASFCKFFPGYPRLPFAVILPQLLVEPFIEEILQFGATLIGMVSMTPSTQLNSAMDIMGVEWLFIEY